ncbi:uncharacterized protein [Panulirus ornatus]|uniref:uncharacterized protein n=1 Tax=Panulirus ornatus TaxID=150431 RepID=UPI003A8B585C
MFSMYSGVRVAVICVLVTAISTTAGAFEAHLPPQHLQHNEVGKGGFPCPADADIFPCTCEFDSAGNLDLTCVNITTNDLSRVFMAEFPFNRFNKFTLQNSTIPVLENGVFGSVTFKSVLLESNNMTTIEALALENSYGVLEHFIMHEEPADTPYTWPLPDIANFIHLKEIDISGPYAAMEPLESSTLTDVILSLYELTSLPPNPFSGAVGIKTLILQETKLENIEPRTFELLTALKKLEISDAHLKELTESSMAFTSGSLAFVNLSKNDISNVMKDAFSGLPKSAVVDLSDNMLLELKRDAFSSLLTSLTAGYIDVGRNPLLCGCDLVWLLYLNEEQRDRLHGLDSSCDIEGNFNFDDLLDFLEYQCSTNSPL